jgi:hypothetical protein
VSTLWLKSAYFYEIVSEMPTSLSLYEELSVLFPELFPENTICYSKPVASFSSSSGKNFPAIFCGHPGSKAMCPEFFNFTGLKRSFHNSPAGLMIKIIARDLRNDHFSGLFSQVNLNSLINSVNIY